ncbi:hypothetical protein [Methylocapsa aurea]|uniref:hypothetical protein n=1 Tax=Methylocapsa aurea TaxID=663610 RepID=UPI0012EC431D|nr:hypothetical protein [Methylocapsa aurea]
MPTLPDFGSLGRAPSGDSGRRSDYGVDTSAGATIAQTAAKAGNGLQAFGEGLARAGKTAADYAIQQDDKADKLAEAQAASHWLTAKVDIDSAVRDEQDQGALRKDYPDRYRVALEQSAAGIQNPEVRQLFMLRNKIDVDRGGIASNQRADRLDEDQFKAGTEISLAGLRDAALKSTDPVEHARIFQTAGGFIDAMAERGYITREEAEQRKNTWSQDFSHAWLGAQPAEKRVALLGGWDKSLSTQESGGNPAKVNQFGYAGTYQFGAPRLADVGVYAPGPSEDLKGWSKTSASAPGKWSGTFNVPGFPEVKTLQDFLANPEAQKAAFGAHVGKMDEEIASNGLGKYVGKTVGGIEITKEGLYAMMHLGGPGGAKRALEGEDVRDANGTSVISYARHGLGGRDKQIADLLPVDRRQALLTQSEHEVIQDIHKTEAVSRAERTELASLIKDDEASLMSTGKPVDGLTADRVGSVLGPQARADFEATRARGQAYYTQTHDFPVLPAEEFESRVAALKPAPGAPGFVEQQAYYDSARKYAQSIAKQRAEDPAGAADQLPEVAAAKAQANPADPNTVLALAKARLIAQERIGIPEPARQPVTKDEVKQIMAPLTAALPGQERAALSKIIPALDKAYGPYADRVLQFGLQVAGQDNETAGIAANLMRKLHNGERPGLTDAAALQQAQTNAAMAAAALGETSAQAGKRIAPPDGAITALIQNPSRAPDFDKLFGPGSAALVLASHRKMQTGESR